MRSTELISQPDPTPDIWGQPLGRRGAELAGASPDLPLSYYWSLVRRQGVLIAAFVIIVTTAITLYTLTRPKEYDATAILRVDPLSSPLVGQDQRSGQIDANLIVATEAQTLTSPAVVQGTIDRLGLAADPEFAADVVAIAGGNTVPTPGKLLVTVSKRISVIQPPGTVLLNVTFRSHRPDLSANIANGLAAEFLEHENVTRAKTLADSSRSMVGQLDSMRAEMETDQTNLVNYEATNDVIDADDKTNIYQARLSAINDDLSKAESARMILEADYRVAMQGRLDTLLASKLGEQLLPLQQRLEADQRELAHLATIDGPNHPLYQQQEAIVSHDAEVLQSGAAQVKSQIADQYQAALAREALIRQGLQQQKTAFDAFNLRAIRYQALKAAADGASRLYYDLQQRIQDAAVAAGLRSEDVAVVSAALPPIQPAAPHPLLVGLLAFLGTLALGIGAAVVAGLLDRTVSSADQLELRFGVHVLGALPEVSTDQVIAGLARIHHSGTETEVEKPQHFPYQEAAYSIYSALQFAMGSQASPVAVTSSLPGEGKSTLISYLAAVAAAVGQRTIVLDADLRKPNLHRIHGLPNRRGLSSVLRQTVSLADALQTRRPNLSILTAGPLPTNPTELLHAGLADLLDELQTRFDCILVDCPPLLGFGDSVKIASLARGVLLVAHSGATQQAQLAASLRQLHSVNAHLLGVVLNRVNKRTEGEYSYYGNYYYRSDAEDLQHDSTAPPSLPE